MRYTSILAFLAPLSIVGCSPVSTPIDISADSRTFPTQAAQGDAGAQTRLGALYQTGEGVLGTMPRRESGLSEQRHRKMRSRSTISVGFMLRVWGCGWIM